MHNASSTPTAATVPSFWRPLVLAFATLALSTWALGSLWLQSEGAAIEVVDR